MFSLFENGHHTYFSFCFSQVCGWFHVSERNRMGDTKLLLISLVTETEVKEKYAGQNQAMLPFYYLNVV